MKPALTLVQLIVSVLLVLCILIQAKGTGLGNSSIAMGESYTTKRGLEKGVFIATIVLGGIFGLVSIVQLLI